MARITEYPETSAPDDNEVVLLDGAEGNKKITIKNLFKPLKTAFQAGVDLIYDAIVAKGVTPADSTPAACAEAIAKMESDVYNAIVAEGVTPVSDTIPGCITGIAKMESDVYNAIVAEGVTPAADTIPGCITGIATVATTNFDSGRSQGRNDEKFCSGLYIKISNVSISGTQFSCYLTVRTGMNDSSPLLYQDTLRGTNGASVIFGGILAKYGSIRSNSYS